MKRIKQMLMCAIATFALCFMFANVITVQAADKETGKIYINAIQDKKGNWKSNKKLRIETYADASDGREYYYYWTSEPYNCARSTIKVEYAAGDKISNLKVNKKKGLEASVVQTYSNGSDYGYTTIGVYATKAGTYKVSFNIVGANGKSKGKQTVTVQAVNNNAVYKKLTFGGQTVFENTTTVKGGKKTTKTKDNTKVSGKAGKLKITPNSQYKITGIIVRTVGSNGKYSYKKIKNGKTITLSKGYGYIYKTASGHNGTDVKKYTNVYVSYKDKFFGNTITYSITSKRGKKEVKYVHKNGVTGEKTVYYDAGSSFTLWQYK